MKTATQEHLQSSCSMPLMDQSEFESDTEDNSQSSSYLPVKVSKVVGLGMFSNIEILIDKTLIQFFTQQALDQCLN